jgi:hypothetical protein
VRPKLVVSAAPRPSRALAPPRLLVSLTPAERGRPAAPTHVTCSDPPLRATAGGPRALRRPLTAVAPPPPRRATRARTPLPLSETTIRATTPPPPLFARRRSYFSEFALIKYRVLIEIE